MSGDKSKIAEGLWQKFFTISKEMLKFIEKNDVDMFLKLLEQRLELQKKIEILADSSYHKTAEGEKLINHINLLNDKIQKLAQKWVNNSRQQQNRAKAYDNYGISAFSGQFSRKY